MKTVKVSTRAKLVNTLLRQAQRSGLILRSPDGREFILAEIDDFNREIELTRKNRSLMKLLDERARAIKTARLSEVRAELGLG